jgi:hypothetical protein
MPVKRKPVKTKPRKRKPAAVKPSAAEVSRRVASLRDELLAYAASQDTLLQVDFLDHRGFAVLRVAKNDRTWVKVAEGPWMLEDLVELHEQGLVKRVVSSRMGEVVTVVGLPA